MRLIKSDNQHCCRQGETCWGGWIEAGDQFPIEVVDDKIKEGVVDNSGSSKWILFWAWTISTRKVPNLCVIQALHVYLIAPSPPPQSHNGRSNKKSQFFFVSSVKNTSLRRRCTFTPCEANRCLKQCAVPRLHLPPISIFGPPFPPPDLAS